MPLIIAALIALAAIFTTQSGGPGALIVIAITTLVALNIVRSFSDDKDFLTVVFLGSLILRLAFGLIVHALDLREFFGGDAFHYDHLGSELVNKWTGVVRVPDPTIEWRLQNLGAGWGMYYLVASLYYFLGRNILAAQSFCAVVGAAVAPTVYYCAQLLFRNRALARRAAIIVAVFPALIIWSGQLLKDGLIAFLLVFAMTMIIRLQEKFSYPAVLALLLSVAAVLPLRFYVFYMLAMALVTGFVVGFSSSFHVLARNTIILIILGVGLTYLGITRYASSAYDSYASLAMIQTSRSDLATSAASGFGADTDVSTTEGALSAVPIGLAYLFLAPFPWQMTSLRSAITLPDVVMWWIMLPLMVSGILWSIKNRFRRVVPILMFTLLLSVAYSIFQGNVGTAYRQRTQIQVFCFIFIAAGWTLREEKRENRKLVAAARQQALRTQLVTNRERVEA